MSLLQKLTIIVSLSYIFNLIYCNSTDEERIIDNYNYLKMVKQSLVDFFINNKYDASKQAYISILMINSAIIPIFLLLSLYNINQNESEYLSSFYILHIQQPIYHVP